MALAAVAYARATDRRQVMVATARPSARARSTWSPPPASRTPTGCRCCCWPATPSPAAAPDPVLQQVEHFGDPTMTVNDAFRPVSRYFDRITRPEQLLASLPQVARVLTDPADAVRSTLALPQDVQAEEWDFPEAFFEPRLHRVPRPRADRDALARCRRDASARPSGRCSCWAAGCATPAPPPRRSRSPRRTAYRSSRPSPAARWCRTTTRCTAGRSASSAPPRPTRWPPRPTWCSRSAPGCRTSPPRRGPASPSGVRVVTVNAARFDAVKHGAAGGGRRRARGAGRARRRRWATGSRRPRGPTGRRA